MKLSNEQAQPLSAHEIQVEQNQRTDFFIRPEAKPRGCIKYQKDLSTGEISPVNLIQVVVADSKGNTVTKYKHVIKRGFAYVWAINPKNALRKFNGHAKNFEKKPESSIAPYATIKKQ